MTRLAVRPWATALVVAAAVVASAWPQAAGAMLYERDAILRGELWRLWSGHAVHFSFAHLAWNLAVLVPAGVWMERLAPLLLRLFLALAPAFIAAVLLVAEPQLARYGGLSALATGLVVLLALERLGAADREPRWIWLAVLVLVGAKLLVESLTGRPLFAPLAAGVRLAWLAHVLGAVAALAVFFAGRPGSRRPRQPR